jgi:phosphoribosyl 1,2-cyclic phosphate phosphodiesterase
MASLRFTILGCGSSGGVPRVNESGGDWGSCDPKNRKNRRRRCSLLVERRQAGEVTRVLIDTSPDMREQLLDAQVGTLDAVVFTHSHADHVHGIDDLRQVVFNMRRRLAVWADVPTQEALMARFAYAFVAPEGSPYPPILDMHTIRDGFEVTGPGGAINFLPFAVDHGSMEALGFRIGPLAYLPDVKAMTEAAWAAVAGAEIWVLDALRRTPHPTHAHLAQSLDWILRARPERAVLTNMHLDMDFATLEAELPEHIRPAFDGMVLTFDNQP